MSSFTKQLSKGILIYLECIEYDHTINDTIVASNVPNVPKCVESPRMGRIVILKLLNSGVQRPLRQIKFVKYPLNTDP